MGHLSLEDIYPEDVALYGHMRVGMTERYVREHRVIKGETTLGELRDLTSQLLRDDQVQMLISDQLASLPPDYDPWIWQINRHRGIRKKNPDFDPWKED